MLWCTGVGLDLPLECISLFILEIDQRTVTLNMLCELRADRRYTPSWLISAAGNLQESIVDLAKQKANLTSLEETAEKATLTRTKEVLLSGISPSWTYKHI